MLAVTLLWRLPSFFDPPWVNDEGTYFAVAQAMAHGYRLYAGIWENKPPALYLVYEAVYHSVGASLPAIRGLATGAVVALVLVVMATSRRFSRASAALAAGLLAGLLMGVPFLEGTTGNAEVFLTVFTALGVYLALRGRYFPAGVSMGVAVLFKVVAGFDAFALLLYLLVHGSLIAGPAMRRAVPTLWTAIRYSAGVVIPIAIVLIVAGYAGILGAMLRDALLYPLGYVGNANGGVLPWLVLLKLAILAGLTLWSIRKPFPVLWIIWSAGGALISGRFFGHYTLQAVPPLCVLFAMGLNTRKPGWIRGVGAGLPILFALVAAGSALVGWGMAATGHDSIMARRLQWYANFVRLAAHSESSAMYRDQVDDHVTRNIETARRVRALPSGKLLVWGNTPWVYVLSGRLPATPYTSSLRQPEVPGEARVLRRSVIERRASVVVVVEPLLPSMGSASEPLRESYRLIARVDGSAIYAVRARRARPRAR